MQSEFTILGLIISFLIGLSFGSFLNCLIYRLHNKKTILGRSFCPQCGYQLKWWENIPLFSFIFLKGKCSHCHQRISLQYPIVELLTGLLFVFAFLQNISSGWQPIIINWFIFFILAFIFIYDLKYQEVELTILWPAIALIFLYNFLIGSQPLKSLLISMSVGAVFFLIQYLVTRGKGIGLGDVWVGVFMGAVLVELKILVIALFFAYIIGSIISLILLATKKGKLKTKLPLAPFLVIGTFIALFWGQTIVNWYLLQI